MLLENDWAVTRVINYRFVAANCSEGCCQEETIRIWEGVRLVDATLDHIRRHCNLAISDHDWELAEEEEDQHAPEDVVDGRAHVALVSGSTAFEINLHLRPADRELIVRPVFAADFLETT